MSRHEVGATTGSEVPLSKTLSKYDVSEHMSKDDGHDWVEEP